MKKLMIRINKRAEMLRNAEKRSFPTDEINARELFSLAENN